MYRRVSCEVRTFTYTCGVEVWLLVVIPALDGSDWLVSGLGRFTSEKTARLVVVGV
jgi:hypothetical protein